MTPWIAARQASLSITNSQSSIRLIHRVSDAIQPSHPLSSPSPPALNPSQHEGLFQWVNSSHEVAKVLEFQLQHHPSKEIPGLISFRMDWLDLLAVQGTLKSLLQHHSSKASVVRRWFSSVQVYHVRMHACLVAPSSLTLWDLMDCNLPSSSVCGSLQARILEWVAIPFSRDLPTPGTEPRSALQADSLPTEPPFVYLPQQSRYWAVPLPEDPSCCTVVTIPTFLLFPSVHSWQPWTWSLALKCCHFKVLHTWNHTV